MKEAMFWLPWRRKYSSRAVCSVCSCLWDDRRSGRGGEGRGVAGEGRGGEGVGEGEECIRQKYKPSSL